MAKIIINALPHDIEISKEEMKKVFGGIIIVDGKTNTGSSIYSNNTIEPDPWTGRVIFSNQVNPLGNISVVDGAGEEENIK